MQEGDQSGGGSNNGVVRRPRSAYTSRIDEKGRLKLPVDVERYLRSIGAVDVFITSFDGRSARIYSNNEWEAQEELLERPDEDAPVGTTLLRRARAYGGDASIDNQGRLLMPARLRKEMGVENQPVWVTCLKGHVEVLSEAEYEAKLVPDADTDAMLRAYERKGLR